MYVIVDVPDAKAVTKPFSSTVALVVLEEDQTPPASECDNCVVEVATAPGAQIDVVPVIAAILFPETAPGSPFTVTV